MLVLDLVGHYVPQLAKKILDYNRPLTKPFINLKGFLVCHKNYTDTHTRALALTHIPHILRSTYLSMNLSEHVYRHLDGWMDGFIVYLDR